MCTTLLPFYIRIYVVVVYATRVLDLREGHQDPRIRPVRCLLLLLLLPIYSFLPKFIIAGVLVREEETSRREF